MKKILLILSLLISSVQTECMFRLGKLALGKIGLAAGISTGAVYGGMKKSSCEPISTPKTNPELIVVSKNTLRDACKKCNVSIVGNPEDKWVDTIEGYETNPEDPLDSIHSFDRRTEVYKKAFLPQLDYLANAAHKAAPLGEKEHAEQAIFKKAPCLIREMIKDDAEKTDLFESRIEIMLSSIFWDSYSKLNSKYPRVRPASGKTSFQDISSRLDDIKYYISKREELVGFAESQEILDERLLSDINKSHTEEQPGHRKQQLGHSKQQVEKELNFWKCFKKGVVNKTSVKEDLLRRDKCGSADGYYAKAVEYARQNLVD